MDSITLPPFVQLWRITWWPGHEAEFGFYLGE